MAIFTVSFFALLRRSEVQNLCRSDLQLDQEGSLFILHIKSSNTDQTGLGFDIPITQGSACGVEVTKVLFAYLHELSKYSDQADHPLFPTTKFESGQRVVCHTPLGKDAITRLLPQFLLQMVQFGKTLDPPLDLTIEGSFASHSFRRGGATFLAAQGWPDVTIKYMGRWRSNTFTLYIEMQWGIIVGLMFKFPS